jgi:hypothetical protein
VDIGAPQFSQCKYRYGSLAPHSETHNAFLDAVTEAYSDYSAEEDVREMLDD